MVLPRFPASVELNRFTMQFPVPSQTDVDLPTSCPKNTLVQSKSTGALPLTATESGVHTLTWSLTAESGCRRRCWVPTLSKSGQVKEHQARCPKSLVEIFLKLPSLLSSPWSYKTAASTSWLGKPRVHKLKFLRLSKSFKSRALESLMRVE